MEEVAGVQVAATRQVERKERKKKGERKERDRKCAMMAS